MRKSFKTVELTPRGPEFCERTWIEPANTPFIVVAPSLVGICGSDIKEVRRERPHRTDFGHEFVGVIVQSKDVANRPVGLRVTLNPNVTISRNSGFSELITGTGSVEHLEDAFLPVPPTLSDREAVFIEPLSIAAHCARKIEENLPDLGDRAADIGIIGAGTMAVLISWVLKSVGMNVSMYNRTLARIQWLTERGLLNISFDSLQNIPVSSFDCVVIATGASSDEVTCSAVRALRPAGILQLFGGTVPGDVILESTIDLHRIRTMEQTQWLHRTSDHIVVCGSYGGSSADFTRAIRILEANVLPFDRLAAEAVSLENLPGRLSSLANQVGYEKSIVDLAVA